MNDRTYSGQISIRAYGEDDDAIFLSDDKHDPFALRFQDDLEHCGRHASVQYWITDDQRTQEQLLENQVMMLVGSVKADYTQHYSDFTGCLWTDVECNVGGHDLLAELGWNEGKWCHMLVQFSTMQLDVGAW